MTIPETDEFRAQADNTRRVLVDREGISIRLHSALPKVVEVGRGQFLVISGDCESRHGQAITSVDVCLEGEAVGSELSPGKDGPAFWQAIFLDGELAGRDVAVDIRVRTSAGGCVSVPMGTVECREVTWQPAGLPGEAVENGLVAICMATYNPDLTAFKRQVDSIRGQDYGNWLCIINDDGSSENEWAGMRRCCGDDERFKLYRNPQNIGFYANFERALARVPGKARFVAFCDQDDRWYPDKLSRLVDRIQSTHAVLVYSDMRIVDAEGRVLANSYWTNRRNEFDDLGAVLVANTVTGAASLFKREILEYLLPFPPRVGDAFHDHWLACVAMSTGRIAYVDEPLYDYYQYGSSVIGHCDFTRFSLLQRAASLVRFCLRMCRPAIAGPLLRRKYASALAVYRGECRRLRLTGQTIRRRCRISRARKRQLSLFDGGLASVLGLLFLHIKVLIKGQTTDDAELRLAMGEFARIVERRRTGGK